VTATTLRATASAAPATTPGAAGTAGARIRSYLPLVGGALLACWVASLAWWLLMPSARTLAIDIPRGAALQVAAGNVPDGLPDSLFIRIGDTLAIHNGDTIPYQVGPAFITPGSYERVPVTSAFFVGGTVFCSFHPGGALAVTPRSQPSLLLTLPIALAAGIPLSLAAWGVLYVVRKLDDPGGTEADAEPEGPAPTA
jgi:hypothetical protein